MSPEFKASGVMMLEVLSATEIEEVVGSSEIGGFVFPVRVRDDRICSLSEAQQKQFQPIKQLPG
ncbi:LOW QUALITY PROTEIN: uncharacterized protein LOC110227144 [Arabidopsis lyrata subsp. lyrata]|uniref:LOW QUALITY PROTEIN: uncharacterized protein LOC110227144 n=1 Tax=Arabidopsis lyrata subsp. lyrata TaxID=81972 RepID=UPI000A29A537|nr:LOW QUALITY PROTEIN: uncharacterized protein LOC110227144 [Arabidopsis lyrata subsp. lyrata]|eukprot:XP_020876155.1 LOW QUALITY PROTEIN: uncharacterized protein LOC110227144 [Arabidopsis lyrata subsp. lyrata]